MNWFHKFFNPHCPDCIAERHCQSCDTLKIELERVSYQNEQLLNKIMNIQQIGSPESSIQTPQPIVPKTIPWRVKQQELEKQDQIVASQLRKKKEQEEIDRLEKELELKSEVVK